MQISRLDESKLDTVTDFLSELGMKPLMHLIEISIFSLNNVTVRPTKIMNRADSFHKNDLIWFLNGLL